MYVYGNRIVGVRLVGDCNCGNLKVLNYVVVVIVVIVFVIKKK